MFKAILFLVFYIVYFIKMYNVFADVLFLDTLLQSLYKPKYVEEKVLIVSL